MKKVLSTFALCFSISVTFCQVDFAKIRTDMESAVQKTTYGKNNAAGKYYDIRGFKMYAEIYGEGQPLLIIHGNGGSIDNFILQIPFFAKKYKVIIADSRAQGKSDDTGDSLTYEMMADDYAALLDKLNIDSANVIGWSDGGINALLLTMRHPKKVKMVAVTGANLRPDTTAVYPEILDMFAPSLKDLKAKKVLSPKEKTGLKLTKLLLEQPNISTADLHNIKVPALIIGGDHDVIKIEHTLEIYTNIANAYLWILPNSGHSTPIVYADEFNKTVDNFFSAPYRIIKNEGKFF